MVRSGFRGEDMLDLLIETAQERLQRLRVDDEHRERHERLIATQAERLRRLIEGTRRN